MCYFVFESLSHLLFPGQYKPTLPTSQGCWEGQRSKDMEKHFVHHQLFTEAREWPKCSPVGKGLSKSMACISPREHGEPSKVRRGFLRPDMERNSECVVRWESRSPITTLINVREHTQRNVYFHSHTHIHVHQRNRCPEEPCLTGEQWWLLAGAVGKYSLYCLIVCNKEFAVRWFDRLSTLAYSFKTCETGNKGRAGEHCGCHGGVCCEWLLLWRLWLLPSPHRVRPQPGVWAGFEAVHHGLSVVHKRLLQSGERTRHVWLRTFVLKVQFTPTVSSYYIFVCEHGMFCLFSSNDITEIFCNSVLLKLWGVCLFIF